MIKRNKIAVLLIVMVLVLSSCATSITLSYMKPAEVNMGPYKNLAVASTVPFSGHISYPFYIRSLNDFTNSVLLFSTYDSNVPNRVASYATEQLYSTINKTSFFDKVLEPSKTDAILKMNSMGYNASELFLEQGYDAVMIPRIDSMSYDEYIWGEEKITKVYDKNQGKEVVKKETIYKINRVATISYSITVVDCRTDKIVAKETFQDTHKWTNTFNPKYPSFDTECIDMFRSMIRGFQSDILKKFVPSRASYNIDLMSNKPKLEAAEPAYKMAKKDNLIGAVDLFKECWEDYGHVPSGYNYALIVAGTGNYDEAMEILSELKSVSNNSRITELYGELQRVKARDQEGRAQLDGTAPASGPNIPEASIYDFIMN